MIQLIFENVGGRLYARLPRYVDGTPRQADGTRFLDIDQAAALTGRTPDNLLADYLATFGDLLADDETEAIKGTKVWKVKPEDLAALKFPEAPSPKAQRPKQEKDKESREAIAARRIRKSELTTERMLLLALLRKYVKDAFDESELKESAYVWVGISAAGDDCSGSCMYFGTLS